MLYEPLADAPQFANTGGWEAEPLRVCGTDAYVDGEYLYQDYVYDDHGGNITDVPAPQDQRPEPDYNYYSQPTGDALYPTSFEPYRHNAADLLEFRTMLVDEGIAYRFTLNTMVDPETTGIAVGIETSTDKSGGSEWGYGLGDLGADGLDHILVTWGTGAELDGEEVSSSVDPDRNQIEVIVPLNPGEETWEHYAVTGLFDTEAKQFQPIEGLPTESSPGVPESTDEASLPPVFNVAFRFDEPLGTEEWPIISAENPEEVLGYKPAKGNSGHWREHAQANALAERDISKFSAAIDFGKLADGTTEYNVPDHGYLNRLYVSHYSFGEGVDGNPEEGLADEENIFLNRIQPYSIYVPPAVESEKPRPMHLFLHGSTSSFNEAGASQPNQLRQLGRMRGAIFLSPEGRGPSLDYDDRAQLDVFEAWADAAAHYPIDFSRVTVGGYSMGGYGTFRLASEYPGLFAKGFPIVGAADEEIEPLLQNLRNVPILMWNSRDDHLVTPDEFLPTRERLGELEYRHQMSLFPDILPDVDGHFYFSITDEWKPAQRFLEGKYLGDATIDYTPARVIYHRDPSLDNEMFGLVHDTAYWVSDIDVVTGAESGTVDITSNAFDVAPPNPVHYEREGPNPGPHTEIGVRWTRYKSPTGTENGLDVSLERIDSLTVWVEAANIDVNEPISMKVNSTNEATVLLTGSFGTTEVELPAGSSERKITIDTGSDPTE